MVKEREDGDTNRIGCQEEKVEGSIDVDLYSNAVVKGSLDSSN